MVRRLLPLLLLLAACRLDPAGRCDTRADCSPGLDCLDGVCASCRSDADCTSWQSCGLDGLCSPRPGRCDGDGSCASWDTCDATHTCVLRADHCPNVSCGSLELCDGEHHCSLQAGRCNVDADCPKWMAGCSGAAGTPPNTCLFPATPGDDLLALGTLVEGSCAYGAASRATTAAASSGVELGFDCGTAPDARGALDPTTGTIVYRHAEPAGAQVLRAFRRDAMGWDPVARLWRFPASPALDDDLALAPGACPAGWDRWVMQAAKGKLMYACPNPGGLLRDFYDDANVRRLQAVQEVLAWNGAGYLLVVDGAGVLQVVSPAGAATAVTGLPAAPTFLAQRVTAAGIFRVALHRSDTLADELWEIDPATAVGAPSATPGYAAVSSSYATVTWRALDDAGALYGGAWAGTRTVILKRPLAPGATAETYSGWGQPAGSDDFTAAVFKPFLRIDRFVLVTRP